MSTGINKNGGNAARRVGGNKKNTTSGMSELKSALDEMSSANA